MKNIAADSGSHILNYVSTNLQSPASNQTDCPRFSETRSWVENFNHNQETVVTNTLQTGQSYNVGGIGGTGTKIEVTMANHPHGAISKTFVGESGWMEALPIATEDWANGTSGSERKRWTWTDWTQDDTNLTYIQNPRVIESKVGDTANIKRSTTTYRTLPNTTIAEYGLVSKVEVYDTNQTTVLKKVETDYNLDTAYVSRRIIGLPSETRSYGVEDSVLVLASKTTYAFDEENFSQETNQNISTVIRHDNTNYSASFITGRGNLTSVTRHDVLNQSASVTSKVRYDIAGSVVARLDPLNRKVKIEYSDVFNDTTTPRNTFAYPTKVFDPAENYSEVKYRFDTGANVWAKSPAPAGNSVGKVTTRLYDAIGRLQKESIWKTVGTTYQEYAYTRFEYPANQIQSKIYSTIIDTNNNGFGDSADEVYSESWADGAGRNLRSRTEHPGSAGSWTGSLVEYDILGRAFRSTVPTEISVSGNIWTPAGDDNRGLDSNNNPVWLWTSQEYDWQSRVTREINTDGTDRLYSYEGCGCAGGLVTTMQSELVPRDDQPTVNARKTQKVYQDILGRTYKTEILNWSGAVYTTTVQTFNRRDQISKTRQYAGTTSSSTYQDVTMTYDGHGRMKTRHYPIEDALTETSWIYNADDTIQQVIDPRNAITTFSYNSRGLVEEIDYDPPANQPTYPEYEIIPDTPTVEFEYDALGNRVLMDDGPGSVSYQYNELSQLTAETRQFDDNLADAPVDAGSNQIFRIEYGYHLSGGLKSVKDPYGDEITYTNDRIGRLTAVEGTPYGDPNNPTEDYADGIEYRAWGAVKQMTFKTDDEAQVNMTYDNRLRASQHEVATSVVSGGYLKKATFSYLADSRPQTMSNTVNSEFNRTFKYDYAGRLTSNQFGTSQSLPYLQTVQYDAFSQITNRNTHHWGANNQFTATYTNGRENTQGISGTQYDAAGNMIHTGSTGDNLYQTTQFDAANRRKIFTSRYKVKTGRYSFNILNKSYIQDYDGDGHPVKKSEMLNTVSQPMQTGYQIWSSVLGSSLTAVGYTGKKVSTKVYAGGAVIAEQMRRPGGNNTVIDEVVWIHADPLTGSSERVVKAGMSWYRTEYEPLGMQEVFPFEPEDEFPEPANFGNSYLSADDPQWQCQLMYETGGYFMVPTGCGIAALANGESWLGPIGESNPKKVSEGGEPGEAESLQTAGDRPVNLTATDKPHSSGGGAAGSPASIPSADGSNIDFEQQVNDEQVSFDSSSGVGVQIMSGDVPGYQDVDKKGKVEFIKIPKDFKNRVLERAGQETECGKKIIQLIDTLESNTGKDKFEQKKKDKKKNRSYIESLFNRVGKIGQNKSEPPFTADTGSKDFVVRGAKISMGLAPSDIIGKKGYEQIKTIDDVYDKYVSVFLHDLVHYASKNGRYTDQELLEAVIDVLKADGKKAPEFSKNTQIASSRINNFFGEYCPAPKR